MKITVLIENTTKNDLVCEHGLSLLIENDGKKILLDTGSTEAFYANAEALNISLESIDVGVLSHGHYDHSGGFAALFQHNKTVKVYALKSAVNPYYSGSGNGLHQIGIPENVLAYRDRFEFVKGFREILPGVFLVPHNTDNLGEIGARSKLYKEQEGRIVPDDFAHEQSLVFDTEKGLVIFNSCSHGGVKNIVREVKEACGEKPIYAYVGGLHMKGRANGQEICTFSEEEVDLLCGFIREEGMEHVYTGHCTGLPGFLKMKERLGDTVQALTTGLQFNL